MRLITLIVGLLLLAGGRGRTGMVPPASGNESRSLGRAGLTTSSGLRAAMSSLRARAQTEFTRLADATWCVGGAAPTSFGADPEQTSSGQVGVRTLSIWGAGGIGRSMVTGTM